MKSLIKIKNNTYTKPNNNNRNISTKQISIIDTKYDTAPEIKIENNNYTVPINEIKNKETNIISTDNIQLIMVLQNGIWNKCLDIQIDFIYML